MFCKYCGTKLEENQQVCLGCGRFLEENKDKEVVYASFGIRFTAYIIDALVCGLIGLILGAIFTILNINPSNNFMDVISYIIVWLYFTISESSNTMGTIGKKALGLKVTTMDGHKISFARANGRFFAKILSSMILCLGYIMAAFTEKKQALHDLIASTVVIKK